MLHANLQANFLRNMENSGSLHVNILQYYNAASTISNETENISTSSPGDHFGFTRKFLKKVSYVITVSQIER